MYEYNFKIYLCDYKNTLSPWDVGGAIRFAGVVQCLPAPQPPVCSTRDGQAVEYKIHQIKKELSRYKKMCYGFKNKIVKAIVCY